MYYCTFIQEGEVNVATWLRGIGLGQYEKAFRDNDVSGEVLAHLRAEDLARLGVTSVGHRRKLLDAIASLAPVSRSPPVGASISLKTALPFSAPTEAERRQLTVMFVDLVGSTELSRQLDPEELRAVMRRYRSAVTEEVDRLGGHVAKFLGDGILAYFGWPKAQEDAAERAVKAALRIVAATGGIKTQEVPHLRARIGIATGLVVIGSLGEGEAERPDEIVGETPNLAARLQQAAGPDQVVISETTRHLVGGIFDLEDLGRQPIKGIGPSVALWRVHGIGRSESRFEGLHGTILTPFVGRDREIDLLLERWGRVRRTMGQVVLVAGEPGIGKSRLVRFFVDRLRGDRLQAIHFDASPYYTNSALRPVISEIRRSAEFANIDPDKTPFRKLELLLGRALPDTTGAIPVIADLLGVRTGEQHSLRDLTPQQRKTITFEVLLNWVEGLATRHPLLMVVEDAQWLDPTTLELVDRINNRIAQLPLLLLITFRPEFKPTWSGAHVDCIVLERLDPIEAAAVAEAVAGKRLPQEVLNEIVAHADGVPLFIEELTKAMRDLNVLVDAGDHFDLLGSLPAVTVPVTLQDALMARLDSLPPSARHAAQVGAVIGREFDRALLASVSDMPAGELETALSELIGAELILSGGTTASPANIFKHALIQDAAYESLLKRRRRELHGAIADALVNRFKDTATAHPELVAGHYGRSGLVEQAVPYYQAAARTAIMRSATIEALGQLNNGLSLLETLPEGLERNRLELGLRLALGDALRAAKGTAAVETGTAYARARFLAGQTGAEHENLRACYGEFLCYYNRAELDRAREVENELMRAASRAYGEGGPIGADAAGFVALWMGDFATARSFLEQRVSTRAPVLDPLLGADIADAGPNLYLARTLLILGYPEQGYRRCRQGLETAEKTRQPFAIALALANTCVYYHLCKDWLALRRDSERLIALASEKAMPAMLNKGRGFRAAALIAEGNATEGLETLKSCYEHDVNAGYLVMMPYYGSILAEAYLSSGNVEDARRVLDDAFERATSTGERWFDAELYRLKGEFALREPGRDGDLAAESFGKSVETAGAQAAKWWELRTATQLARLWAERGAGEKAHDFLTHVRDWFTEGFETADVREAEALLSELERATLFGSPSARRE